MFKLSPRYLRNRRVPSISNDPLALSLCQVDGNKFAAEVKFEVGMQDSVRRFFLAVLFNEVDEQSKQLSEQSSRYCGTTLPVGRPTEAPRAPQPPEDICGRAREFACPHGLSRVKGGGAQLSEYSMMWAAVQGHR